MKKFKMLIQRIKSIFVDKKHVRFAVLSTSKGSSLHFIFGSGNAVEPNIGAKFLCGISPEVTLASLPKTKIKNDALAVFKQGHSQIRDKGFNSELKIAKAV